MRKRNVSEDLHTDKVDTPPASGPEADGQVTVLPLSSTNGESPTTGTDGAIPVESGQAAAAAPSTATEDPKVDWSRAVNRLDQVRPSLGLDRHAHTLTVGKTPPERWFRVHPDPDYTFDTILLHLKEGKERGVYQVASHLYGHLSDGNLLKATRLVLTIDRQNELRLWPLRLPELDGREDDWMTSALAVCEQAKVRWVRLVAESKQYISVTTSAPLPEPTWPKQSFDALLDLAFRNRRIASADHPLFRHLLEGT
jgi:hypothetical protein